MRLRTTAAGLIFLSVSLLASPLTAQAVPAADRPGHDLVMLVRAHPELPALVRLVGSGRASAADKAHLKEFPALAAQVIDPGLSSTTATIQETPIDSPTSPSGGVAALTTGNGNYASAITISSTYKSALGSTIYIWQHAISVNRNGTNVTSLNYRKEIIPQRQPQIVVREFWVNNNRGMGTTRYVSELGRTLEACLPAPVGCYATYQPRSEIYAYGDGYYSWNADAA